MFAFIVLSEQMGKFFFYLRQFNVRSKVFEMVIREFLYSDGIDLVHNEVDLQVIMDYFSRARMCMWGLYCFGAKHQFENGKGRVHAPSWAALHRAQQSR